MRNGNLERYLTGTQGKLVRSYPTYEEWKLSVSEFALKDTLSSYPTYEEWKQFIF